MNDLALNKALASIWEVVSAVNKYVDETAPWSLAKEEKDRPRLGTVLYHALESVRSSPFFSLPSCLRLQKRCGPNWGWRKISGTKI
jgi:methionyl-tRNA synthetase